MRGGGRSKVGWCSSWEEKGGLESVKSMERNTKGLEKRVI
jgi:hypothetical protein